MHTYKIDYKCKLFYMCPLIFLPELFSMSVDNRVQQSTWEHKGIFEMWVLATSKSVIIGLMERNHKPMFSSSAFLFMRN